MFNRSGLPVSFWLIFVATVIARCGFFVESFLTIYMKSEAGFDAGLAALLMALYGIGGAVTALLSGPLIDRFGAGKPLLVSLLLTAGAAAMLATGVPTWLLGFVVLLMGGVGQVIMPATNAQVSVIVPQAQQRRAFSLVYIGLNSGLAFGPLIGGYLAGVSFSVMFTVGAALIVVGAAFALFSNRLSGPSSIPKQGEFRGLAGLKAALQDRVFLRFNMMNWLFMALYLQVFVMLPLIILHDGMTAQDYGIVMAVNGTMLVVTQLPVDRAVRRFSTARLLTASAIILSVGLVMNAFATSLWFYLAAAVFWTLSELINIPLAATVTATISPNNLRGSYLAVHGVAFPIGVALASLMGGVAFYLFENPKLIWVLLAVLSLMLALLRYRGERSLAERLETVRPAS